MGKLMVGLARVLLLCAVVLVLPAVVTAQCISQLIVQRVFTQDDRGGEKTIFAPGEVLVEAAEVNNSYGEPMLEANGTQFVITEASAVYAIPVDIPPGISTLTAGGFAPSTEGSYTFTISVYDHFCDVWVEGNTSFTIEQPPPGPPSPPPPLPDFSPNLQPTAPSGLYVKTSDSYGLWLGWAYNSFDESGFEIFNGVETREVGAQTSGYRWGAMEPGEYMCFKIRAYQDVPTSEGGMTRSYSDWEPNVEPWYRCGTTPTGTSADEPRKYPSDIWAGYGFTGAETPAEFIQVTATWWVPRVECPPWWELSELSAWRRSRAAPWVGISGDPYSPDTTWLIQGGTVSQCKNGEVSYTAVWEIVAPRGTPNWDSTAQPFDNFQVEENDKVSAHVLYDAFTGNFTLEIFNFSKDTSASVQGSLPGITAQNSRSWALCIVESEPEGCGLPNPITGCLGQIPHGGLAKFTTPIEMTGCGAFEGHPAPHALHQWEINRNSGGDPLEIQKATTHPLDISGSFTVEWLDW